MAAHGGRTPIMVEKGISEDLTRTVEFHGHREQTIALPEAARIRGSRTCQRCGEMVMETRTRRVNDVLLCIPCAESAERKE